jgi:hypothetical protein
MFRRLRVAGPAAPGSANGVAAAVQARATKFMAHLRRRGRCQDGGQGQCECAHTGAPADCRCVHDVSFLECLARRRAIAAMLSRFDRISETSSLITWSALAGTGRGGAATERTSLSSPQAASQSANGRWKASNQAAGTGTVISSARWP